jgi:hypothetical protein
MTTRILDCRSSNRMSRDRMSKERMTKERMTKERSMAARISPAFLLATMGLAATLACGTDDENDADTAVFAAEPGGPTANGLALPPVQDWGVVGVTALQANGGQLRVVVGNDTAVKAARSGQTNPWPEGTALANLVWDAEQNPVDPDTVGPGAFKQVALMMKDTAKYAADGGWAYGVWMGSALTPPPAADFDRVCVDCHTSQVKGKDYVFANPGDLPDLVAVGAAADGGNGVAFPEKVLDWRLIGVASVRGATPTIRAIVGNPTAVTAARSRRTDPWPDGSLISHYVWAAGENPMIPQAVVPGAFGAVTLMQRSSAAYSADGNWAYGRWGSKALMPLAAGGDRVCVDCHTSRVPDRDMVFSEMAEFPPMMMPGATVAR